MIFLLSNISFLRTDTVLGLRAIPSFYSNQEPCLPRFSFPIMSNNVRLQQVPSARQQPLLQSTGSLVGEIIGETTAECAVVCCCLPCTVANLVVLAVYKVPAGLCRRALRRRRKQILPQRRRRSSCGCDETENKIHPNCAMDVSPLKISTSEKDNKLQELEKEMWERFYGTGFWRSQSQRESSDPTMTSSKSSRIPINSGRWEIVSLV